MSWTSSTIINYHQLTNEDRLEWRLGNESAQWVISTHFESPVPVAKVWKGMCDTVCDRRQKRRVTHVPNSSRSGSSEANSENGGTCNVNPGWINHGLLIRGVPLPSQLRNGMNIIWKCHAKILILGPSNPSRKRVQKAESNHLQHASKHANWKIFISYPLVN